MATGKKKVNVSPIFQGNPIIEQIATRLQPYQREIVGGITLLVTIITLLSLLSLTKGSFSDWWANLFEQLFGWGAIPAVILLGVLGGLLTFGRLRDEEYTIPFDIIIGVELLFVVCLSLFHLLASSQEQALQLAQIGAGGGFVGWGISDFLIDLIGWSATGLVLLVIGIAALGMSLRLSITDAAYWTDLIGEWAQRRLGSLREADLDESGADPTAGVALKSRKKQKKSAVPQTKTHALSSPSMTAEAAIAVMPKARHALPPLELLSPPAKDPAHSANARYQAQIIEETLYGFGVPAEVVETNRGPTVTQFGLKLGTIERKLPDGNIVQQRIRVNKVVSLSNDLALALSAAPIRIEAPVPGQRLSPTRP